MKAARSTATKAQPLPIVAMQLQQYSNETIKDLKCFDDKLKEQLEWSDVAMLRSILVFLDTQNQFDSLDKEKDGFTEFIEAMEYIIEHFRELLEAKVCDMSSILDEVKDAVQYARKFFSLADDYQKIWYNLHVVLDASKCKPVATGQGWSGLNLTTFIQSYSIDLVNSVTLKADLTIL